MGLSICLSALIQSCRPQLDFRHRCGGGETAQMAAEATQHQVCADILNQASSFGTFSASAVSQPSSTEAAQAASVVYDARHMYLPQQHPHLGLRPEEQQHLAGTMPGLFPLLANMQGQTNAMLHLNMQPAQMYGFNQLPPVLSAPALSRVHPGFPPSDAAPMAAHQRASMDSGSATHTRPSLDDASMLSRLYPSSSLDSSFSHQRMSIDDPQHRLSSGSRHSSVSLFTSALTACCFFALASCCKAAANNHTLSVCPSACCLWQLPFLPCLQHNIALMLYLQCVFLPGTRLFICSPLPYIFISKHA